LTDEDFGKDEGEYRKKTLDLGPSRLSVVDLRLKGGKIKLNNR